jgi:AcrR family transcriptional regulator
MTPSRPQAPEATAAPTALSLTSCELPVVGQAPRERADAARNRERLLNAAAALVEEHGAQHVTMDAVAGAACVGKGTLFRRFGDRAGLMLALLDHAEQEYQRAFMSGPAPLGPDAPPQQRLEAFGLTTVRHLLRYIDLYLAAEDEPAKRCLVPARMLRVAHVSMLLRQSGTEGEVELAAQALVNFLDPILLHHLIAQRGIPVERIEQGWRELVQRTLGTPTGRCPDVGTASAAEAPNAANAAR